MGRFSDFDIDLSALSEGKHDYQYKLDNAFFKNIDSDEISKGKIDADVELIKRPTHSSFSFNMRGVVIVACDKCLDDMEIEVEVNESLNVKFGDNYGEENDNTIIIPYQEKVLNLSFIMYDFIELSLPMKHSHPAGKCNKTMTGKLNKHIVTDDDDSDNDVLPNDDDFVSEEVDPRWDKLKEINIEND